MSNSFAKIISIVLHPLLMPTYLFSIIILLVPEVMKPLAEEGMLRVLLVVFVMTFILPVLSLGILRISSYISSLDLDQKNERVIPSLLIAGYYGVSAYFFYDKLISLCCSIKYTFLNFLTDYRI